MAPLFFKTMEKRLVYSDNGTLEDKSIDMNNFHDGQLTKTMVADEDYIYIGSRYPFNSVYFLMNTPNTNSGAITAEYWDGDQWREAVEVLDETNAFNSSGHITFVPNRDYSWTREHTNYNNETITGLSDVVIYDKCWIRLSISADSSAMTFSWVGDVFCTDDDIYGEYPEFERSNTKESFQTGKTDWFEQIKVASEMTVKALVDKGVILGSEQILNWRDYTLATVQKVAEIIYGSFGDDYLDAKIAARNEFSSRITKRIHRVDRDGDAIEDVGESQNKTGFASR